jgi:carbonic anhydrase
MSDITTLLERNRVYAESYQGKLPMRTRFSTIILTCLDARIDPAYFLGIKEGDALVMRNAGGRVTEDVEKELGILSVMAKAAGGDNFKGLSLAIVQHTDCGYERLANPQLRTAINHKTGIDINELESMENHNHTKSLEEDIQRLRDSAFTPDNLIISGHILDVDTGIVQEVYSPKN